MLGVRCLWVLVCLQNLRFTEPATKKWKFNNDIQDPKNWEGGKPSTDCKGVIFPRNLDAVASVFELYTSQIVLPVSGELEIRQGGFIEITQTPFTCIRIAEIQHKYWLSPDNWDYGDNAAIPDVEKVPCVHDDVIFSPGAAVAVLYPEVTVSVNSIQIGGIQLSNQQWQDFLQSDYGGEQFYTLEFETSTIQISPQECTSRNGCTCHNSAGAWYWICENMEKRQQTPCFDPIRPVGHCSPICGGTVLLEPSKNFDMEKLRERMPKYDKVDSYASKVVQHGKTVIQVVFAEKNGYEEVSTDAASNFHSLVSGDLGGFQVKATKLLRSGPRIPDESAATIAFAIILGTFAAVSFIFLWIYAVYMGPLQDYDFSSRLPITQFSFGKRSFLFAKFENREEGQMSMAGSVISLQRAFDNPMYGSHRPSTSSAAVEVVVINEAAPATSESSHQNPAFAEMTSEEVEMDEVKDVEE